MKFTQEQLETLEAKLAARQAQEMANLDLMGPEELLDLYDRKIAAVEMATSMEALEEAEDDVAAIKAFLIESLS